MPNPEHDAVSVPELRRRVRVAVAHLREMRHALAVQAGMTLEEAPGPIPEIDTEAARVTLEQMMEALPLLRRRLTSEERAELHPVTEAQNEQMKEVLDELLTNKEAYEELAEGGELPSREQIVTLRESFEKTEMLREFERELQAYRAEVLALRERLEAGIAGALARLTPNDGPPGSSKS